MIPNCKYIFAAYISRLKLDNHFHNVNAHFNAIVFHSRNLFKNGRERKRTPSVFTALSISHVVVEHREYCPGDHCVV